MISSIRKDILPFFLFLFFAGLYIHNLSRSVYGGDVGDLITAATVFGVPHPPGYPLFTLLGFLLTRIHILTPAFRVGLISAISSAISVGLFYVLSKELSKNKLISLLSALILGFTYLFWFYAEIAEVFALNNLFVILLILLAIKIYHTKKIEYFYALCFFSALSITAHQIIVLIFPSLLILIFNKRIFNKNRIVKNYKVFLYSTLLFLVGLLVYIYVPIASFHNPPINWDHVKDINSFLNLVLRRDYGTFSAGSFAQPTIPQKLVILKSYFFDIFSQLTIPVVLISLTGAAYLFLEDKRVFLSVLIGFILSGPFFIFYAGFPLLNAFYIGTYERFFIESSILFLMFFPVGLKYFIDFVNKVFKKKTYEKLFIAVFFIIPILLFHYNFQKTDLHNVTVGDDLAYALISPLPKNSILLLSGDTVLFNAWYVHYALNVRPDIRIVNLYGIAGDAYLSGEIKKYIKLNPKEEGSPDQVVDVISYLSKQRPVFSYEQLQRSKGQKLVWIPYGLTFKLLNSKKQIPSERSFLQTYYKVWDKFNINIENSLALGSLTISDIPSAYADGLLATGGFLISQYNDNSLGLEFYQKALTVDPNYNKTYEILGIYYLEVQKNCSKAEDNFNKAISIFPFQQTDYYLLYATYESCKNKTMENSVAKNYSSVFKVDFFKDLSNTIKSNKK